MRTKYYFVYILANKKRGMMYTGFTNDIERRTWQHKESYFDGYSKRYGLKTLVWFETHQDVHEAIHREKLVKHWRREWKFQLIEAENPEWRDLWDNFVKSAGMSLE